MSQPLGGHVVVSFEDLSATIELPQLEEYDLLEESDNSACPSAHNGQSGKGAMPAYRLKARSLSVVRGESDSNGEAQDEEQEDGQQLIAASCDSTKLDTIICEVGAMELVDPEDCQPPHSSLSSGSSAFHHSIRGMGLARASTFPLSDSRSRPIGLLRAFSDTSLRQIQAGAASILSFASGLLGRSLSK